MTGIRYSCASCLVDWFDDRHCWNCGQQGELGSLPYIGSTLEMVGDLNTRICGPPAGPNERLAWKRSSMATQVQYRVKDVIVSGLGLVL